MKSQTPRDPTKPVDYYQAFVTREEQAMAAYTQYNNPALYKSVTRKCVCIGGALYSAGADVSECREWFKKAADFQLRFIVDGAKFKPGGIGTIDDYLELYAAAFLVGQSDELIAAVNKCSYTQAPKPFEVRLLTQFFDFLQGRPVETNPSEIAELNSIKKEWAYLPPLFSAVSAKSPEAGESALDDYLSKSWSPLAERSAKQALKSPAPEYWGKWSFLSAAAAKILGKIPQLGAKARAYLPVELATN